MMGPKVDFNVDLRNLNTYGIGGTVKSVYHPKDHLELIDILKRLDANNIKWYVLGSGSNVILPDGFFDGAIIKLDLFEDFAVTGNEIYVSAGMLLSTLINKMLEYGFVNMAPLMGIPGTVGGAVIGNAGSFGTDTFSHLVSVTFLTDKYEVVTMPSSNIKHSYRYSEFKDYNKCIILGATFQGVTGNVGEARNMIKDNIAKRVATQPLEYRNAGSVFKNPEGMSVGKIVEELDLKGFTIGGAEISKKHGNFIINTGNATSNDIIELIDFMKSVVLEKRGIALELEQIIVKW